MYIVIVLLLQFDGFFLFLQLLCESVCFIFGSALDRYAARDANRLGTTSDLYRRIKFIISSTLSSIPYMAWTALFVYLWLSPMIDHEFILGATKDLTFSKLRVGTEFKVRRYLAASDCSHLDLVILMTHI